MNLARVVLAVVVACSLASALATSASARSFEVSSQTFRASFRELRFRGVFGTTNCVVTLEGSLHTRIIAKSAGALIGYITRATLGACSALTATMLSATLPWHIRYAGFSGALPNIERLRTDVVGFSVALHETGGITCLLRSAASEPVRPEYEISAGTITGVAITGSIRTGAECFGAALTFTSDRAPVTVLNSTTRITLRLI